MNGVEESPNFWCGHCRKSYPLENVKSGNPSKVCPVCGKRVVLIDPTPRQIFPLMEQVFLRRNSVNAG